MIHSLFLSACALGLFVVCAKMLYRNLTETCEAAADEKYKELYKNANVDCLIDVKIIDER